MLRQFLEFSIIGIASGGMYVLSALGFVIIFKATRIFNFAMGEMMMLPAFIFLWAMATVGLHWVLALMVAILGGIVIVLILERVVMRRMIGRPVVVLVMVTLGAGSVMRGIAGLIWGHEIVTLPNFIPRDPIFLGDILIPGKLAWSFLAAAVVAGGFVAYYRFSRAGIAIRATASDLVTAEVLGVNVRWVYTLAWMLAGVLAAVAGILAASVNGVSPQLGFVALNVLAVIMLAGMTSVFGVLVAGLFIGWLETIVGAYLSAAWQSFLPYVIVLLVMMVKPSGLFGEERVERI
ncbi:branched-chain amino acid ABC transporter permease [Palleronia abyssalis]|uniref:High-affinity branched-chain amino acid transport system permease protein LivH n=1 Tax=Palleronia abyssalis TaxID=1501240 RepID=A0A2R8BZ38_9RHOB|nr:branched-chain amino acid ABC transporter permease [Palleronia abyssalis]SPJ25420.1 High-affinity branched-chain amino acid transport system permease protein LivH [Palleronia abyssalis]